MQRLLICFVFASLKKNFFIIRTQEMAQILTSLRQKMTFRMPMLKTRSLQEALKIGAHAPSRVMSLSSCYEMRNIQSVVKKNKRKTSFFYADIVSDVIITCCSACTYVCACLCAAQLQQSLLAFGRSTRKLIRDVMEEQQRALDILSSQVKWSSALITKFENM